MHVDGIPLGQELGILLRIDNVNKRAIITVRNEACVVE